MKLICVKDATHSPLTMVWFALMLGSLSVYCGNKWIKSLTSFEFFQLHFLHAFNSLLLLKSWWGLDNLYRGQFLTGNIFGGYINILRRHLQSWRCTCHFKMNSKVKFQRRFSFLFHDHFLFFSSPSMYCTCSIRIPLLRLIKESEWIAGLFGGNWTLEILIDQKFFFQVFIKYTSACLFIVNSAKIYRYNDV